MAFPKTDEILYIPLTIHLVGTDEGEAYFQIQDLLDQICSINQTFAAADIQFFLEGEVNYINNTEWYLDFNNLTPIKPSYERHSSHHRPAP